MAEACIAAHSQRLVEASASSSKGNVAREIVRGSAFTYVFASLFWPGFSRTTFTIHMDSAFDNYNMLEYDFAPWSDHFVRSHDTYRAIVLPSTMADEKPPSANTTGYGPWLA
jgi:hypothetical protein